MNSESLLPELLDEFRNMSTCVVADAIETFDLRLRNAALRIPRSAACFRTSRL